MNIDTNTDYAYLTKSYILKRAYNIKGSNILRNCLFTDGRTSLTK